MLTTRSGRNPSQNEFELRSFIKLLQDRHVRAYLEIGARHGDTFFEVVKNLPPGSRAVAVDLPGGLWGTVKSKSHLQEAVNELCHLGYQASVLYGDSKTDATRSLVQRRGPYDAMLIDGDHTLVGVSSDWDNYGKMAPIVAFHDIVGHGQAEKVSGNPVEVPIFWGSIRQRHETVQFVDQGSAMGIGVVLQ